MFAQNAKRPDSLIANPAVYEQQSVRAVLPLAAAAAAAAATVVTTRAAEAATATATTATAAAAAVATTATAAAAAATAAAGRTRLSFVDAKVATIKVGTVHRGNRGLSILIGAHLDEAKTARTAGFAIGHDLHAHNVPTIGSERCAQRVFISLKREITNVESRTHRTISTLHK